MLIIADARLPKTALQTLSNYGEVFALQSKNIVYDSISGHPDIFICQDGSRSCILAPNSPQSLINKLKAHHINYQKGTQNLGTKFPLTAAYNAVVTEHYFIHHLQHSDTGLRSKHEHKTAVHIPQAYSRCNLLALPNGHFICSDKGIENAMQKAGFNIAYFSPQSVILKGHQHGFLGGCMGIHDSKIFIIGSLQFYEKGDALRGFLQTLKLEIIELYTGTLIDGGGILFFNS